MRPLRSILNPARAWIRLPLKGVILAAVIVGVLFPQPSLLLRDVEHWRNIDAVADPNVPALEPLAAELRAMLPPGPTSGPDALRIVQRYVNHRIPYAFDWEVWGVADYVPTINEILDKGREDCDGRAVLAAALLKRLGYDARIRCDGSHVWVWTPEGQTMAPVHTSSGRTLVASTGGGGTHIDLLAIFAVGGLLFDMPADVAYGVSVFPLSRELIIVLTIWALTLRTTPRPRREFLGMLGLVTGLLVLRFAGSDPWSRASGLTWTGLSIAMLGMIAPALRPIRRRPAALPPADDLPPASALADPPYPS